MLVLTRKRSQSIMIGDEVEISILSITGDKVKIGIEAPRDIPIFRKEIYVEMERQDLTSGPSARAEVDEALRRLSGD
jgi:carbon storage regulator